MRMNDNTEDLTEGWYSMERPTYMEVLPVHDVREHYAGDECWCIPTVEIIEGGKPDRIISHNKNDVPDIFSAIIHP